MSENDNPARTMENLARIELISAIRVQTDAARKQLPGPGAANLRNLAEAYAVLTAEPLPLLTSDPVDTAE